jgi:hypothetical protein
MKELLSKRRCELFVASVWLLTLLSAVAFIMAYGHNIPLWDDFILVPFLSGDEVVTPAWLWAQHNEHRIPLPKLILLALLSLSGGDFRAGMFFNVFAMGTLALGMIWVVRGVRGWTSCSDAFFPLILLQGGQYANFTWCFTVQLTVTMTLTGGLLLIVVARSARDTGLPTIILAGICLVALPLCGGGGLPYVPPLALWLGFLGMLKWWSGTPRGRSYALVSIILATTAILLVLVYFFGYEKVPYHLSSPGLWAAFRTGINFLSMSFGYIAIAHWRVTGAVVAGLGLLSVVTLLLAWQQQPSERLRCLGLACFIAGLAGLAAGVGWGRSGVGNGDGLELRYVTLAVPALCSVYFVLDRYGPPAFPWTRTGLLMLAALTFLLNIPGALKSGRVLSQKMEALERDLSGGLPLYMLAHRYTPFLAPCHACSSSKRVNFVYLADGLRGCQRAGIGAFKNLTEDPPFRHVPLALRPTAIAQMTWLNGAGWGAGPDSYLLFSLPKPTPYIAGISVRYIHSNPSATCPGFRVFWKRKDQSDFAEEQSYTDWYLATGSEEHTVTVYICAKIDQLRIHPDILQPFSFRISGIELLTLPTGD